MLTWRPKNFKMKKNFQNRFARVKHAMDMNSREEEEVAWMMMMMPRLLIWNLGKREKRSL